MAVKKTTSTSRAAAKIANAIKAEPAKAAKTAAKAVKEEEKTAVKAEEKAEVKASEKAPVKAEPEKKEAAKAIETKKDDARQQHVTICRDAHHRDIRRCKRRTVLRLPCLQQLFGGSLCRHCDLYALSTPLYRRGRQRVSAG